MQVKYRHIVTACLVSLALGSTAAYTDLLPTVGSRVRIQAKLLDAGWHEGMFNGTRTEPPCYVVLIFKPRGSRTAAIQASVIVPVQDISYLDVHTGTKTPLQDWAGLPSADSSEEHWQRVAPDVLREVNKACPHASPMHPAPSQSKPAG